MAQRIAMRRSLRSVSSGSIGTNGPIQSFFLTAISPLTTTTTGTSAATATATAVPNIVTASNHTPSSPMTTTTSPPQPSLHTLTIQQSQQHRRAVHTAPTDATPTDPSETGDPPSITDPETECPPWQNPILHARNENSKFMLDDYEEGETPPIAPLPPLDLEGDGRVLASPKLHELADEIVQLNMMEVKELVDRVAEHFGIEDDGGVGLGMGGGGGGEEVKEEEVEEKTAFDIKLTGFDAKTKIKVIKEVRALTALGLKEAKAMVDDVPSVLKSGISKDEAEEMKAKLEGLGATVEVV